MTDEEPQEAAEQPEKGKVRVPISEGDFYLTGRYGEHAEIDEDAAPHWDVRRWQRLG